MADMFFDFILADIGNQFSKKFEINAIDKPLARFAFNSAIEFRQDYVLIKNLIVVALVLLVLVGILAKEKSLADFE